MSKQPKVLFWDIETSLIVGKTFQIWNTNVLDIQEDWYMLSFSWRWGHEKTTYVKALCDYPGYNSGNDCEKLLVKDLWKLIDEADVLVHHNGDKFDLRKSNAKFLAYGLKPYSPVKSIDTLKQARKHFGFTSNKLNELGKLFGVGTKTPHTGIRLWLECMEGDLKAFNLMKKYSKQDTILLYEVYNKLLPWITPVNMGMFVEDGTPTCPNCCSEKMQKRGYSTTNAGKYQRYQCTNCGKYSKDRNKIKGTGNPLTH